MTQPAPTPRKSRLGLIIAMAAAAVILLCGGLITLAALIASDSPDQVTATVPITTSGGPTAPSAPAPGLNQPVRDGQFEFTILKVQCGVGRLGGVDFGRSPQGQYCLITMKVTNIGDEARLMSSGNQYAYNAAGQRYDADSVADLYIEGQTFLEDINPGNSVTGRIAFDIPKGAVITRLELHDSLFSGGVSVSVPAG